MRVRTRVAGCAVLVYASAVQISLASQWLNYPTPGLPRLPNGKVNLAARTPRTADGRPDLSGVWHVYSEPLEEKQRLFGAAINQQGTIGMEPDTISKYAVSILLDHAPDDIVMTPEAQRIFDARRRGEERTPNSQCLPAGMPRDSLLTLAHKIVETSKLILITYEGDLGMSRQIYTDGRPLPVDPIPSWLGYSIGMWDGDTLVVDTIGFNDRV